MVKITFGKTEHSLIGDMYVEIFIDGFYASTMKKAEDGPQWYTYGDEHEDVPDADHGRTLRDAKKSVKAHITESIKERERVDAILYDMAKEGYSI